MRVLWLTNSYPHPADPVGGTFLKTQAEALVRAGAHVHVIAPVPWVPLALRRKWQRYRDAPHAQLEAGVSVARPRYLAFPLEDTYGASHLFLRGATRRSLYREGGSVKAPFSLIHAHFAYPQGLVARALSARLGVPYVLTLHGSDVNTNPQQHPVARRRFGRAVRGAARVLAVSQPLAQRTETLAGVTPEVSPIGLNLRHFALPSRAEARRQLGLPVGAFIALYVGYLYEAKGIREWLEALTNLDRAKRSSGDAPGSDVLGLFLGDGPLRNDVERTPNARALGALPNAEVPRYLAAADVLVLPSYAEGMPTVLIEAGAAGLPVIATEVGGIPDLLAEGRGYTVPPRSTEALTDAVHRVRADPAAAHARAARLQTYVRRHYDADENARRLLRLYGAVAGREAPTRGPAESGSQKRSEKEVF